MEDNICIKKYSSIGEGGKLGRLLGSKMLWNSADNGLKNQQTTC